MSNINTLRNNIIDKLLTISNQDYLNALDKLLQQHTKTDMKVNLSDAQIALLKLSDLDIENNQVISQDDLDKEDLEWLKGL
ncbi:hypothetical protein [Pedobacter glucosidilyticus]|uniref:hypothetical protein n=1 Tax=Pedobacter glucosidilyticus TaxID=1122941 RepID=UPI00047D75DA|nr:hypothetical protein [Pedobacter glucosidilyticus]